MARTVTTFFNMKENYSSGMRRAATATSKFQRQVTAAARVLVIGGELNPAIAVSLSKGLKVYSAKIPGTDSCLFFPVRLNSSSKPS